VCCGDLYDPNPRAVNRQKTCKKKACKRKLKTDWQKTARRDDADYRANDAENSRAWRARNPDYNREWRRKKLAKGIKVKRKEQRQEPEPKLSVKVNLNLADGSCQVVLSSSGKKSWEERYRDRIRKKRACANEDGILAKNDGHQRVSLN
jgi:hypothetical protein